MDAIERARTMRQQATDAESLLWSHLRARQLDRCKFRRQHPIGRYVTDFACIEAGLVVELDGGQHAEPEARELDRERTRFLESRGYRVLRFWNHEVLEHTDAVLQAILECLCPSPLPSPRSRGEGDRTAARRGAVLTPSPLPSPRSRGEGDRTAARGEED